MAKKETTEKVPKEKKLKVAEVKHVNEALFNFQGENISVPRNGKGTINGREYRYATLDDTMSAIRPALNKYGLMITQIMDGENLITKLVHPKSNTEISGSLKLGNPASSQDLGSRITYLRRYALNAMLGLVLEDDPDGGQNGPDKAILPQDDGKNRHPVQQTAPAATVAPAAPQKAEEAPTSVSTSEKPAESVQEKSATHVKALGMISSCVTTQALDKIRDQIQKSTKLTDAEKSDLQGPLNAKAHELAGN